MIVYYSGHNDAIELLMSDYELTHKDRLKYPRPIEKEFYYINNSYKQLLMMLLLLKPESDHLRTIVMEKLGLVLLGDTVKFIIRRPNYAKKEGFEIDPFVEETRFWRIQGDLKKFS